MNGLRILIFILFLTATVSAFDFYVSPDGDAGNPGSFERPFKSLQQAATVMRAGDTCFIRGGVYREAFAPRNDGEPNAPVTFMPYEDEKVIIAGTIPVSGWIKHVDDIYKVSVKLALQDQNMVLFNGELMDLARWPNNEDGDPFTIDAVWNMQGTDQSLMHTDIPNIDWTGGILWFLGTSRWTSWRRPITKWEDFAKRVYFELPGGWEGSQHSPKNRGEFYLMNKLEALDASGEWFYDKEEEVLYFQAPGNINPNNGDVQIRKFVTAIDLNNRSYIRIQNLNIIGAGISMENARGCVIENTRIKYGNHTIASSSAAFVGDASIKVSGSFNRIENCHIYHGASYGISLGGNANRVMNCLVHDFNWLGSYSCPIYISGEHNRITHSTFYNGGRDCVRMGGQNHEFAFNDVSYSNLINDDCGLLYTCCHDGDGTQIHHNWFHDAQSRGSHYKAAGVYLDNSTQTYDVFNNVIWNLEWSAVQINWDGWFLNIFNNTIWDVGHSMAAWHKDGTWFQDVLVYNNLSNDPQWDGTDYKTNLVVDEMPFTSLEDKDFRLLANSSAIDYGTPIEGYTTGYLGSAPDAGAYEYGAEPWKAGIDWQPQDFDWNIASQSTAGADSEIKHKPAPNPGIGQTSIIFSLSESGSISISVFNILGQKVKTLLKEQDFVAGEYKISWDGSGDFGFKLSSGTYFYTIQSDNKKHYGKLTYIAY